MVEEFRKAFQYALWSINNFHVCSKNKWFADMLNHVTPPQKISVLIYCISNIISTSILSRPHVLSGYKYPFLLVLKRLRDSWQYDVSLYIKCWHSRSYLLFHFLHKFQNRVTLGKVILLILSDVQLIPKMRRGIF